jgi:glycosyltransferase involved in cell wall biosynthesis
VTIPVVGPQADAPITAELDPRFFQLDAPGRLSGHAWEQFELPFTYPDRWLLNLCNTAPVFRRRQAVLIHDAQVALHPDSYSWAFRSWYKVMIRMVSWRADLVFTVSEFSKAALEQHGLVPVGKLIVVRNGIDHMARITADRSAVARLGFGDSPYILALGSLAPHKNLAMLLDAFVAAELPAVDLVVAGGGNSRVFQRADLPQATNIRYAGRVSDAELKALYEGALAFAFPSLSEGFGLPPLEAMSMGCPVVATTGGAVPEVCGDAAIYADPLDPRAWRDALRTIVTDGDLRADLGRRATARAGLFLWRDAAVQMLDALAEQDGDIALRSHLAQAGARAR